MLDNEMTSLTELKTLALAATQGPYHISHITEYADDRVDVADSNLIDIAEEMTTRNALYFCAANPATILNLISKLEICIEALETQERARNHTCNVEYGNSVGVENCLKCKVREALAKVATLMGGGDE